MRGEDKSSKCTFTSKFMLYCRLFCGRFLARFIIKIFSFINVTLSQNVFLIDMNTFNEER